MKNNISLVLFVIAVIAVATGLAYLFNRLESTTVPLVVSEPEPGIHCVMATTSRGIAISCYPAPEKKQ